MRMLLTILAIVVGMGTAKADTSYELSVKVIDGLCGVNAKKNFDDEVKVCHSYSQDPYLEYIVIYRKSESLIYRIVSPTRDTYLTEVNAVIERGGEQSTVLVRYHYERGFYPGDGEYYPISIEGKTPDGLTLDVRELSSAKR